VGLDSHPLTTMRSIFYLFDVYTILAILAHILTLLYDYICTFYVWLYGKWMGSYGLGWHWIGRVYTTKGIWLGSSWGSHTLILSHMTFSLSSNLLIQERLVVSSPVRNAGGAG